MLHQRSRDGNRLFSEAADLTGAMSEPGEAETPVAAGHKFHNAPPDRNKPGRNLTDQDTSHCPARIPAGGVPSNPLVAKRLWPVETDNQPTAAARPKPAPKSQMNGQNIDRV